MWQIGAASGLLALALQAGSGAGAASLPDRAGAPITCFQTVATSGTAALEARIAPASPAVRAHFSGAGSDAIRDHDLSIEEQALVETALARLPRLHREVLQRHLRRLSFLDVPPGGGSALTSRDGSDGADLQFDITLRSGLLHESLTVFLNIKERRLFADDGSGFSIAFDAGRGDALTYVLLHEATHVVDQVMGLSGHGQGSLNAAFWKGDRALALPYEQGLFASTPFRRPQPVPLRHAPAHYESLRQSPFVSFYATAAAAEDLAELFAWQQLASRFGQTLSLTISDRMMSPVFRYAPLATAGAKVRFGAVQVFFDRYEENCPASDR